ncbi:type IV secretion system protein VirB10 [Bryocella elongata]|uniref:Type IV secretion system protein VirB10 n=1 Tax=Bryocella elongata TaxID=863522 RepID=A0A1H6CF69_9BACT|nr:TrbI/VirB10 family protein [Bryocella elongata]SEG71463.1 type IV secretion system protein VirB10 [Bryocella elongata]
MPEPNQNLPATVPEQPESKPPLRKSMPVVIALVVIIGIIGISNLSSLLSGNKRNAPASALPMRPAAPNAQQVNSFESQQQLQAQRDAEARQHQRELNAALQQLQQTEGAPGPEAAGAPPMTAAQRSAIYGDSPNAPQRTSNMSQAQAEAKQKQLAKEKQQQDAINSDTVAIDFERTSPAATAGAAQETAAAAAGGAAPAKSASVDAKKDSKGNAMAGYDFDTYDGRLYRIFEGTVLEGVVTNHIDGGFSGPIMVSLTTDLYSHDHQQLLLPQGTRLLGYVQSVGNAQQRKMFVTFHRAICPDGFSLEFAKYIGLDQIGTTGLATKVDHGYLQAFAAAAAIGGLGGLAQIGNGGSVLDPSVQIRNGISEQSAVEGEQVLNHFLNRLPIITLKEGSRARVYIGTDLLIPAYAEHRVDPTL